MGAGEAEGRDRQQRVQEVAREGPQIELVQKQLRKSAPSLAIRSMLGVSISLEP